jgi:hypothetical protein
MTIEEINNNLEFKAIKKVIKQRFPYIVDLVIQPDIFNAYTSLFVAGIVDVVKAYETKGYTIFPWVADFQGDIRPFAALFNIPYDEYRTTVEVPIKYLVEKIQDSDIIPKQHKLKRMVLVSDFMMKPVEKSDLPPGIISDYT